MTWLQVAAVGLAAGMGFTVSLFFTQIAFTDQTLIANAKLGILAASIVAVFWDISPSG